MQIKKMGIVSTTDKSEAKETGKEFLDKDFFKYIGKLKKDKIRRCLYCSYVLHNNNIDSEKRYCSDWCREQDLFEKSINNTRECKKCETKVYPFIRKKISKSGRVYYVSTGVFPNLCKKCGKNHINGCKGRLKTNKLKYFEI